MYPASSLTQSQTVLRYDSSRAKDEAVDFSDLQRVLEMTEPLIVDVLEANRSSHPLNKMPVNFEASTETTVSLAFELNSTDAVEAQQADPGVTYARDLVAISHNASGVTYAFGFGDRDYTNWPESIGRVLCVNLLSLESDVDPVSRVLPLSAATVIETDAAITSLAFHPQRPQVLAVGDRSGNVYVYDLGNRGVPLLIASTHQSRLTHHDAVTNIHWVRDPSERSGFRVISVGHEGMVLHWHMSSKLAAPVCVAVVANDVKETMQVIDTPSRLVASDLPPLNQASLLVGTRIGKAMLVNLAAPAVKGGVTRLTRLHTAATRLRFKSHWDRIYSLAASPLSRSLFLTTSEDARLIIRRVTGDDDAIIDMTLTTQPTAAAWSPHRVGVVAVGSTGRVLMFDLTVSIDSPVEEVSLRSAGDVTSVSFNKDYPGLLVVIQRDGTVSLLELGSNLHRHNTMDAQVRTSLEDGLVNWL